MNGAGVIAAGVGGAVLLGVALAGRRGRAAALPPLVVLGDSIAVGTGAALSRIAPNVTTLAVVGEGVPAFERQLAARLARAPRGATVVVSMGTNSLGSIDAREIAERVQAAIDTIRAAGYRAILLGPPPARAAVADGSEWDELWRLAVLHGHVADSIDLFSLLGDPDRPGYYAEDLGAPDGLHPRVAGYNRIAQAILEGA